MGALNITIVLVGTLLICDYALAGFSTGACPEKHKVTTNKPICHTDADCRKLGKICCPNQYNTKSCTVPAAHTSGMSRPSDSHRATQTGVRCEGVVCRPGQVCKTDRVTGKKKCQ